MKFSFRVSDFDVMVNLVLTKLIQLNDTEPVR